MKRSMEGEKGSVRRSLCFDFYGQIAFVRNGVPEGICINGVPEGHTLPDEVRLPHRGMH